MKVSLRFAQHTRRESDFTLPAEQRRINPKVISHSRGMERHFPSLSKARDCFVESMKDDPNIEHVAIYKRFRLIEKLKE